MIAKFYNCIRDERYVQKICAEDQTNDDPVNVEMLTDSNNVTHPIIRLSTGKIGKSTNYVWLKDLKRFYYIRNWTMDNGYITLNLEVDVLMSFKKELLSSRVMIKRNEFKYNSYLTDPSLQVNAPTRVKIHNFEKGFDETKNIFYLATVGGQGIN